MTGYAITDDHAEVMFAGFSGPIEKPVVLEPFASKIAQILSGTGGTP